MAEGRVIVGVSESLSSLAALHRAVDEARHRGAVLVPVLAWAPPGGETAYRTSPCPPLLTIWEQAAAKRLETAFEQGFGGRPVGVRVNPLVMRDRPGRALVRVAGQSGDMLVVGMGGRGRLQRLVRGSVSRYCLAHARCPVVAVPPSELQADLGRLTRGGDPMAALTRCLSAPAER
jgi:nucleotide-binding universal stress UspA family protein